MRGVIVGQPKATLGGESVFFDMQPIDTSATCHFRVSRKALEDISGSASLPTLEALMSVFEKHEPQIFAAVEKHFAPGSEATLTSEMIWG